ncbi:hypothetical protein SVIOM342S_05469 [Streptomyces violaceorubidus]
MAAQATAVQTTNVIPVDTAARLRSVNHSSGTKETVGWKAAATPISTPPTR